jgi:hypothetical protein
VPKIAKSLTRTIPTPDREPVGHHGGIHRARTGCAYSFKFNPMVFQKPIEHAPSECAVRASTLECQIDGLRSNHGRVSINTYYPASSEQFLMSRLGQLRVYSEICFRTPPRFDKGFKRLFSLSVRVPQEVSGRRKLLKPSIDHGIHR